LTSCQEWATKIGEIETLSWFGTSSRENTERVPIFPKGEVLKP